MVGWLFLVGDVGSEFSLDDARPQAEGRVLIGEYLQRGSVLPFVCAQCLGVHCFDGFPSAINGRSSYQTCGMVPAFWRSYSISIGVFRMLVHVGIAVGLSMPCYEGPGSSHRFFRFTLSPLQFTVEQRVMRPIGLS